MGFLRKFSRVKHPVNKNFSVIQGNPTLQMREKKKAKRGQVTDPRAGTCTEHAETHVS